MLCTIMMIFAFTFNDGSHKYEGIYTNKKISEDIKKNFPSVKKEMTKKYPEIKDITIFAEETYPEFDCDKGPAKK